MLSNSKVHKKLQYYNQQTKNDTIKSIELFEASEFDRWASVTWCRFMFTYCNNDFNKAIGRIGRIASFRIGTTNPDLIPTGDKAKGRKGGGGVKRYYDVSRAGTSVKNGITSGGLPGRIKGNSAQQGQWRSFRNNTFSILVEIWSFEKEQWVSKAEDFNNSDQNSG